MNKIISWVEIPAADFKRAVKFYNRVLEIEMKPLDWGNEKMACLPNDEGAISFSPGFKPSSDGVLLSLNAGNNMDGMLARIVSAGGRIVHPKSKIEAEGRGYFALFIDTEGNKLGLYSES